MSALTDRLRAWQRRDVWIVIALAVVFTVIRLPFRSEFLINWDAVNFALGIQAYDLGNHQPHAPGYIGYVLLGRLFSWLTGSANTGLTLLSTLAGGLLPTAAYVLGRRALPRGVALATAILLGTSPVVWYYSSIATTYVIAAAVTVLTVWAAHVARTERSHRALFGAAMLLALLGSLRQTDYVLLLPVLAYAAWAFPWRRRLQAAGMLGAFTLAWLVPLMIQAGGPLRYLRLSRELAELAGGRTWALGMNAVGMLQNVGLVGVGLLLGLNIALLILPLAVRHRRGGGSYLGRDTRRILWLWAAPALFTYVFIHTGQIGYVLLVLPVAMLWIGAVSAELRDTLRIEQRWQTSRWAPTLRHAAVVVTALLAVLNLAAAFAFPRASYALLSRGQAESVQQVAEELADSGVPERTRQYLIPENDAYWKEAVAFAESFDPDEAVVLGVPVSGGSFRHLAYYLDDHTVYGIGRDRSGRFGHLFVAEGGSNDYSVSGLSESRPVLTLPPEVEWLIVPDDMIQTRLPDELPRRSESVEVGADLVAVRVDPGSALLFDRGEEGEIAVGDAARFARVGGSAYTRAESHPFDDR